MMADNLDKFIEEQKAKLAQDKAQLENDPPYMEMRNKESEKLSETSRMLISMAKENIPPNSQRNYPLGDYGLSLPLGEEYERKKHKLKEELRQDYKRYLSQKNYLTTGEVDPYTRGLSLPIDERRSAKERLQLERNKEYNQYLRDKEEWNERLRKLGKKKLEIEMGGNKKPVAVPRLQPELLAEVQPCDMDTEPPKKDAFTSTEELLSKRWLEENQYNKLDDETALRSRLSSKRLDEDLDIPSQRHRGFASQSVIPIRKHHRLDEDREFGRRYYRMDYDPETSEEMDPRMRCESAYDRKTPRAFYGERSYVDGTVRDLPVGYEDELKERARVQQTSRTGNSRHQIQISSSANGPAKSAGEVLFATGLALGGQDQDLLQRRKEKYRQELIEQIAEQQRNKRREKELDLSVAASGVRDPEKNLSDEEPNRLRQFGVISRAAEERVPAERPQVAFQTPVAVPSASPVNEDFHRGLASTFGEIAAPRLTPMPPPPPPVVMDSYRTPYDGVYYFYGARNPLDPNLAYYSTGMTGMQPAPSQDLPLGQTMQPAPSQDLPLGQTPAEQSLGNAGQSNTGDRQRSIEVFSEEKSKPSKGATLSYQEALRQQIREREERRKREREEKERFEAKLKAEMRNYNPWGRGGGGAPLRDAEGNLITDLNMMHKQNEDAYLNPEARLHEDKKAVLAVDLSLASPRPENTEASTNKIEGVTVLQTSPFARGNVFSEPLSPQHLKRQESYKNFLRLQIEEKRRREEAERLKIRMEEERDERRLNEERMRLQKAYEEEEEKRKRKEETQRLKNEAIIRLDEERQKEAEKRRKEREEKHDEQLKQHLEKEKLEEEKKMFSRQPSPVVPALRNRLVRAEERVPSAESHVSSYTQDPPQPRTPSPPVPARRNQLRAAEETKNVIRELSEMRRRLQEQLLNVTSDDDLLVTGERGEKNPRDVFEMARLRLQAPVRRPSSREAYDPVNMQNIWEFNELKYKDSDSRVGVRHMYPDPPRDDWTLEIQQQALLREQRKKLDRLRMRRETEASARNPHTMGPLGNKSNDLRNSLLESDSAFINANGETFPALGDVNVSPQLPSSARERRQMKLKALECVDDAPGGQTPQLPPDGCSSHSSSSLDVNQLKGKNEERLCNLAELQQNSALQGDDISLGEAEDLWKRTPSSGGRCPSSIDTIATEPWLRPGTSETLHSLMAEGSSPAKLSPESSLPLGWHGLSTAHG